MDNINLNIIVLSPSVFLDEEIEAMHLLFENGLTYYHLRKPEADKNSYIGFLEQINPDFHARIIIHNHFELTNYFDLKGIHLNSYYTEIPQVVCPHKSRSCHSFEEVLTNKPFYNYLFLSPIFDSISKKGYQSTFGEEELRIAKEKNIIDNKVIALGGVNLKTISSIATYGFGGAAVLGYLWDDFSKTRNLNTLLNRFLLLQQQIKI